MKRVLILAMLSAALVGVAGASHRDDVRVSFGFFYSTLAPHGEWIEVDPDFYVWRPLHVRHGWRPYLHGRWVWTSHGWYWVSYEPFGWAVFHYGRWYYDDFYGWVWVPDYVWGPAWVEWRYNDDYIGWAPLPPYATFSITIGIHFTRVWVAPVHYWTFVGCRYFTHHRVVNYVTSRERTRRIFGSTRGSGRYSVHDGRVVNRGIDRDFVERRIGRRVESVEVTEVRDRGVERLTRDGGRERIEVYRPTPLDIEQVQSEKIEARKADRKISLDVASIRSRDDSRVRQREEIQMTDPKPMDSRALEKDEVRLRDERLREQRRPSEGKKEYRRPQVRKESTEQRRVQEPRKSSEREISKPTEPRTRPERKIEQGAESRPRLESEAQRGGQSRRRAE